MFWYTSESNSEIGIKVLLLYITSIVQNNIIFVYLVTFLYV